MTSDCRLELLIRHRRHPGRRCSADRPGPSPRRCRPLGPLAGRVGLAPKRITVVSDASRGSSGHTGRLTACRSRPSVARRARRRRHRRPAMTATTRRLTTENDPRPGGSRDEGLTTRTVGGSVMAELQLTCLDERHLDRLVDLADRNLATHPNGSSRGSSSWPASNGSTGISWSKVCSVRLRFTSATTANPSRSSGLRSWASGSLISTGSSRLRSRQSRRACRERHGTHRREAPPWGDHLAGRRRPHRRPRLQRVGHCRGSGPHPCRGRPRPPSRFEQVAAAHRPAPAREPVDARHAGVVAGGHGHPLELSLPGPVRQEASRSDPHREVGRAPLDPGSAPVQEPPDGSWPARAERPHPCPARLSTPR
jgi:hypothetical protein